MTTTRNILIADDDPAIRAMVSQCLTDRFTACTEAADGAAAVRLAAERRPDVVLLDLDMPVLDGIDACRSLKFNPRTKRIPVVFLTSAADVATKVRGFDIGAADYVTKPFAGDELRARVRSVLRGQREARVIEGFAARDEATGLFNRAYLQQRAEADLAASRRYGRPLACVMVAIDGDAADAEATDEGMRAAAIGLLSVLRREDVACRYDDHAFAVLAFTENRLAATALADRVRTAVAGASPRRSVAEPPPHPTVSVGLALSHYSVGDSLLWHASEALAHARRLSPGTTQFGGELSELHLVDRSFN